MSSNNYYEILGVRPNAAQDEIELAYKGRRSQYHPDRYAQSDADTQAWATAKMQDVNEAYEVLASAELRARFDRRRASDQVPPTQARPCHAAPEQAPQDAAAILLKPEWEWFHDKVYARPNIPRKKLEGAISSYASGVSPDEVIILLDDTLFGGAKEGLLVTNNSIYCKQKFESPRQLPFKAIRQVEPGTDSRVIINGAEFFKADIVEHLAVGCFAARLSHVFKAPTPGAQERVTSPKQHGPTGVDGLWTLHRGAITALRTEFDGSVFLVDELIGRQMRSVAHHFPALCEAVRANPRHKAGQVDAEAAEGALMLFLILHFYGFSKLPSEFKQEAGDQFTRLHAFSEVYKLAFQEGFPLVYGRPIELDGEDLLMMSAMFLHRDGTGEFELKIPREEALQRLLSNMGFQRTAAMALIRQFEDHAAAWLEALSASISR